jgi:hypothetical protein
MPVVWGGPDLGSQIWCLGFFLLAAMLLWSELVEEEKAIVSSNKVAFWFSGGCDLEGWSSRSSSSPSCRGGEGRGGDGVVIFFRWLLPMLKWCGDFELNHADDIIASAIFSRQGRLCSTSDVEAFHRVYYWSSARLRRQVVHPWRLGGAQQRRFFAGRELASILPLFLGGDALRTPTSCGGDARGPDCFFNFCSGVFTSRKHVFCSELPQALVPTVFETWTNVPLVPILTARDAARF